MANWPSPTSNNYYDYVLTKSPVTSPLNSPRSNGMQTIPESSSIPSFSLDNDTYNYIDPKNRRCSLSHGGKISVPEMESRLKTLFQIPLEVINRVFKNINAVNQIERTKLNGIGGIHLKHAALDNDDTILLIAKPEKDTPQNYLIWYGPRGNPDELKFLPLQNDNPRLTDGRELIYARSFDGKANKVNYEFRLAANGTPGTVGRVTEDEIWKPNPEGQAIVVFTKEYDTNSD